MNGGKGKGGKERDDVQLFFQFIFARGMEEPKKDRSENDGKESGYSSCLGV